MLIVEQKSAGRDLDKAYEQAGENSTRCPSATALATYVLVSDFQTFELRDLGERESVAFPLAELPGHVEAFGFILEPGHRPAGTASSARAPRAPARVHDATPPQSRDSGQLTIQLMLKRSVHMPK